MCCRFFTILCYVILAAGCHNDGIATLDSGLQYKIISTTGGPTPANGEYILLNLRVVTATDSVIYNSEMVGALFPLRYDTYRQKIGLQSILEEGFYGMRKNDSTLFFVKGSDLHFLPHGRGVADEYYDKPVLCYAKLVDIMDHDRYQVWKTATLKKRKHKIEEEMKTLLARQTYSIDSMLQTSSVPFEVSPLGIRYIIKEKGRGPSPESGDSVSFRYTVTYLNGTALPKDIGSSGDKPRSFRIGAENVIPGWQESVMQLREGGAGKFYIPSPLAFGSSQSFGILPNSILIADIWLVDLHKQ